MAKHRLRVATSPESASSLHGQEAREGETACLARLAHRHRTVRSFNVGVDNILAALGHKDRVCGIVFRHISTSLWEEALAAMQVPLPALTRLDLVSEDKAMPVVPDSFLEGPAPRLRSLYMARIPFPGLPRLLSYATDLVDLELYDIPQSGYISPDQMATCLSMLTSLETLRLEFEFPRPRHIQERARPPPQTRSALPALTYFTFRGVSEYLEDLVAGIDAPFLEELKITSSINSYSTPRI